MIFTAVSDMFIQQVTVCFQKVKKVLTTLSLSLSKAENWESQFSFLIVFLVLFTRNVRKTIKDLVSVCVCVANKYIFFVNIAFLKEELL